jgi:CO/xanthine dehydrogenase Mo-binding subunit
LHAISPSGHDNGSRLANSTRDSKDKLMNILPGNLRFGAGQPVKRLEDQRLLTGKGAFIDDRPEDGALWLYVLRSPHAHARINSIDTKAAAEMPGRRSRLHRRRSDQGRYRHPSDAFDLQAAGRQTDDGAAAAALGA